MPSCSASALCKALRNGWKSGHFETGFAPEEELSACPCLGGGGGGFAKPTGFMSRGGSDWPSGSPEAGGLSAGSAPKKACPGGGESPGQDAGRHARGGGLATRGRSAKQAGGAFLEGR